MCESFECKFAFRCVNEPICDLSKCLYYVTLGECNLCSYDCPKDVVEKVKRMVKKYEDGYVVLSIKSTDTSNNSNG